MAFNQQGILRFEALADFPVPGDERFFYVDSSNFNWYTWDQSVPDYVLRIDGEAAAALIWGMIGGDITDQADLQAALALKADLVAGKVPAAQLPSYVLEYADLASFPATGETGKIYIALDTNKTYRWSGSVYVEISSAPVSSVFGRLGSVIAQLGDYSASLITNTPSGDISATTVQAALNELDSEKESLSNKTDLMSGNEASSTKYLSSKGVYDWATGFFVDKTTNQSIAGNKVFTNILEADGNVITGPGAPSGISTFASAFGITDWLAVLSNSEAGFPGIILGNKSTSTKRFAIYHDIANDLVYFRDTFGSGGYSTYVFYTSNLERMRIALNGNVGIGTNNPGQLLEVTGNIKMNGIFRAYRAISATDTAAATDFLIDCTSGTFTVNLPTAVGISGRAYCIKNSGNGVITVDPSGAQTIDGSTTYLINTQYDSIQIVSNGANWVII